MWCKVVCISIYCCPIIRCFGGGLSVKTYFSGRRKFEKLLAKLKSYSSSLLSFAYPGKDS